MLKSRQKPSEFADKTFKEQLTNLQVRSFRKVAQISRQFVSTRNNDSQT